MTDNFIDTIFEEATKRAHTRFWVISDLQQGVYERAERYMSFAINDLNNIPGKLDGVCYLGDASEGTDLANINRMIDMQLEKLDSLALPIYYTIGNHETVLPEKRRSDERSASILRRRAQPAELACGEEPRGLLVFGGNAGIHDAVLFGPSREGRFMDRIL